MLEPTPKQSDFIDSNSFVNLFGGANAGGKTCGIVIKILVLIGDMNKKSRRKIMVMRLTHKELVQGGGVIDEILLWLSKIYTQDTDYFVNMSSSKRIRFRNGAMIYFDHMFLEKHTNSHDSAQITDWFVDQAEKFTIKKLMKCVERVRVDKETKSLLNFNGRVSVNFTFNPDPDSPLTQLVVPFLEKIGRPKEYTKENFVQYYFREREDGTGFAYSDKKEEEAYSYRFIPAFSWDNPHNSEDTINNLKSLNYVEREQRYYGNFFVRGNAGDLFPSDALEEYEKEVPEIYVRFWDLAGRKGGDDTVGCKAFLKEGIFYIADIFIFNGNVGERDNNIKSVAIEDGNNTIQVFEQEPGSGGVSQVEHLRKIVAGITTSDFVRPTGSKIVRSRALQTIWQNKKCKLNANLSIREKEVFTLAMHNFDGDDKKKDDIPDATFSCYNYIVSKKIGQKINSSYTVHEQRSFIKKKNW